MLRDLANREFDRVGDANSRAFGVRCDLAIASKKPDASRNFAGDETKLLLDRQCALFIAGRTGAFHFFLQLLNPGAISSLCILVQNWAEIRGWSAGGHWIIIFSQKREFARVNCLIGPG